jgi:hypothetical protein
MNFVLCATVLIGLIWLVSDESRYRTAVAAGQEQIIGNGRLQSEERPITAVTVIDVNGAFELRILVGQAPKLTLTCDANILPIIRTSVSDGRLAIFSDRSYSLNRAIKITVSTPHLTGLSASGSNRVEAQAIDGSEFSISLDGSNDAVLTGNVSALVAQLGGSSRLAATGLTAGAVKIRVAGSGEASVAAREQVVAEVSGSGSIAVHGNPRDRQTQVNGSGKIAFIQ